MPSDISDTRLLALLNSGNDLKSQLDPDGVLSSGIVTDIVHSEVSPEGEYKWKMSVLFTSGDCLVLHGRHNNNHIIESAVLIEDKSRKLSIDISPFSSVLEALGDLSRLPARLKKNLCSTSKKHSVEKSQYFAFGRDFFHIETNALFWGVEYGEPEKRSELFHRFRLSYSYGPSGVERVSLSAQGDLPGAKLTVNTYADLFGLGKRIVTLDKDFGDGRNCSSICNAYVGEKLVPSVLTAVTLNDILSKSSHIKQKRKKKSLGKPKAK